MECSVSRAHKTRSLSVLFKDFPRCDEGFAQLFMPTQKSIRYSVNSNVTSQDWNKPLTHIEHYAGVMPERLAARVW